jgi:DNA processing protein
MNDLYPLLCLLSIPGIGPHRIRKLVNHFGSPEAVLKANIKDLMRVDTIDQKTARGILQKVNRRFAEKQLVQIDRYRISCIRYWDPEYPENLKRIYDPPVLLFVKGKLTQSDRHHIAVVGMRSPSEYGRWIAEKLGQELAQQGIVVVSGMARGIDTRAHYGVLKASGTTLAVLGCGVDVVYPPENRRLYERIMETGAVLSEFPMGAEPAGGHFPRRNRIISGLSLGTVVVEAGERSGALITAYMALEQGREVFAIPGSIRSSKSRGTHKLLKEGAKLVECVDDILVEIPGWVKESEDGKQGTPSNVVHHLSSEEQKLWQVLTDAPLHIDQIAIEANVTTPEALAVLLSMELKNCVKQLSGMMFVRTE